MVTEGGATILGVITRLEISISGLLKTSEIHLFQRNRESNREFMNSQVNWEAPCYSYMGKEKLRALTLLS